MQKRLADPGEQRTGRAVADRSAGLAAVDRLVAVALVAVGRQPVVADTLAVVRYIRFVEALLALLPHGHQQRLSHLACSVHQLCGVGGDRYS